MTIRERCETETALVEVRAELSAALRKFERFHSAHEGWAVIREELDELWEEVKKRPDSVSRRRLRLEAKQVAAMSIRFMIELTDAPEIAE